MTAAEYSIDFMGAQGVGMGAVLMDLAGAYRDTPHPRVESLAEFVIECCNPSALTRGMAVVTGRAATLTLDV